MYILVGSRISENFRTQVHVNIESGGYTFEFSKCIQGDSYFSIFYKEILVGGVYCSNCMDKIYVFLSNN